MIVSCQRLFHPPLDSTLLRTLCLLLLTSVYAIPAWGQQPEVPCFWRPTSLSAPWIGPGVPCLEAVARVEGEDYAFAALAVSDDDVLYAARPFAGQVLRMEDTDGDGLPETSSVLIDNLHMPTQLAWYANALYIVDGDRILRWQDETLETLVSSDDLDGAPLARTALTIGVATELGDEAQLYFATESCLTCTDSILHTGVVWRVLLDEDDPQPVAHNFAHVTALAIHNDMLYVLDNREGRAPDALFRISEVNTDFGPSRCLEAGECEDMQQPLVTFPVGGNANALMGYSSDVLPAYSGGMFVTLSGSYEGGAVTGYQVVWVSHSGEILSLIPSDPQPNAGQEFTPHYLNTHDVGFFPRRPLDLAINSLGWVYVSVSGGSILAIRPQSEYVY